MVLVQFMSLACGWGVEFQEAEITTIKNMVERDEGAGAVLAKANDKIRDKAKVSTAAASMAELMFADSSITRMGANTLFSFQSKERLIKLDQGTLLIHTPPGNGGATVDCGGVTAAVSGTTFMATRDQVGNSVFVLLEGSGGMKITVGGTSTTIRPGQAAAVGVDAIRESDKSTSGKNEPGVVPASAGTKDQEAGKVDPSAAPGANKGGDNARAAGGESADTGSPLPAAPKTPPIKVFEVDIKKIVQTTPLITEFKTPLPSVQKIEATVEIQQSKVQEGKLEKMDVEVVAVAHGDGDLLVSSPTVSKEDMQIVNPKETVVENSPRQASGGDGLDIATAAGPEAGAGAGQPAVVAAPPPRVETPTAPAPAPTVLAVNPAQIVTQPSVPPLINLTVKVNNAARVYNQGNPAFGFSITAGSLLAGHSLVTEFLTSATAASSAAESPFAVNFSNLRIVDGSGADVSGRYNLTTVAGVLNVLKANQTVSFDSVGSLTFGQSANLVASALAGGISFAVVGGPGTIDTSGKLLATGGTGSVVVRATAVGDGNYNSAFQDQTITLAKADQSVSFTLPSNLTFNASTGLSATALDSGTVSFTVLSGPGTIDGSGRLVATSGTGSVVVRATAVGDGNYNSAFQDQTITLSKANQVLNFGTVPARLTGSSASLPVFGVQVGSPNFSVLETDGRATVDSVGLVSIGKILGADSFTLRAAAAGDNNYLSGQKDVTVDIQRNIAAIEAANPTRRLLSSPDAADLSGLDEFFYFTGKAAGYTGGPDRFFAEASVGGTDRTLTTDGGNITVRANQNWDMYAAKKFTQDPGSFSFTQTGTRTEAVYYATGMDLGAAFTEWGGLGNPEFDSSSLGFRYLTANANYLPVFDATVDPVTHKPMGFVDTFGGLLFPLENFPVWDDEKTTGNLGPNVLQAALNGFSTWSLAAGTEGFAARGIDMSANGSKIQVLSAGDIHLQASRISGVGSWATTDPVLTLEARGKIKIGAETMTMDPNGQEIPFANRVAPQDVDGEALQVRLESAMPTGAGTTSPGQNIAVIRTGDSLELRNLTIRGFSDTALEKLNPTTQAREGRVLVSGSAVRDFKIKELVGAAVNADAKIQMMALDGMGALAGDMVVEGKMPVQAKLASALAEVGEILPTGTAGAMVDARQIDLAAHNLKLDNANLVAMNSITARANTILVQNSFMTVVRNQGMINMYVQSGLVNTTYGSMVTGRVNFAGLNTFTIGNTSFAIGNQAQLTSAYGNTLIDLTRNGGTPQAGKVNVLKL